MLRSPPARSVSVHRTACPVRGRCAVGIARGPARRAAAVVLASAADASASPAPAKAGEEARSGSSEKWITGLTPNSAALRLVASLAAVAAASQGAALGLTARFAAFLQLVAWGTWFGATVYTTFVLGLVLFKSVPRQTFRDVQEVLFPAFFQMSALCVALLLALSPESGPANALSALAPAFAAVLANLLFLEHKTTDVMKRRAALERMDDAAALAAYPGLGKKLALKQLGGQFGKWHGLSSAANLVALCGAIAFGWGLAL